MKANLIVGGIIWTVLALFFSAFIIWFDRKKFSTPQMGLYYILLFFAAGILLLAISLDS